MKTLILALALVSFLGCGPVTSTVTDGTYFGDSANQLGSSAQVTIDRNAKTATVSLSSSSAPIVLTLTALSGDKWQSGCPTNFSSVLVETFTIAPDPAVLGSLSLSSPRLVAGCGQDKADPNVISIQGTGEPNSTQYVLNFQRLTR